tara:strand:- start:137 stop:448 length:312 start_codon:yes stop_codon:yes gene_type:complete
MATRCTIKVEGIDSVKVYKHYDGYPEATLEWLSWFNEDFTDKRGDDPEYKIAQLLRSSVRDSKTYGLGQSKHTGWGILPMDNDAGEDFEYVLHKDGNVSFKSI